MAQKKKDLSNLLLSVLNKHFDGLPLSELVTANRLFPPTARPDLQKALEQYGNHCIVGPDEGRSPDHS